MNTFEESLQLNPGAKPKFFKARAAPSAMKEAIGIELDRLESVGVVEKANHSKIDLTHAYQQMPLDVSNPES